MFNNLCKVNYPINSIALKYAKALCQKAAADQKLKKIYADMCGLYQLFTDNRPLVAVLKNPLITHDKKLAVLHALFQEKVDILTLNFFAMVIENNRSEQLPTIAEAFLAIHDQYKAIVTAQVTVPSPLSASVILQLQQIVQQITTCRQVRLEQRIDSSLIGGYILQVKDKRIDQSLRSKLRSVQKRCTTEGAIH